MLRELDIRCVALHSSMTQNDRLAALAKFKSSVVNILLATDVGSRGLDIPLVDLVINYDGPSDPTDYIHRVGRTARAGRGGQALTVVAERDIDLVQSIEEKTGKRMDELELKERDVLKNVNEVSAAERSAALVCEIKSEKKLFLFNNKHGSAVLGRVWFRHQEKGQQAKAGYYVGDSIAGARG